MQRVTLAELAPMGADELVVRVTAYDKAGVPFRWQAIVRHKNRSLGWSVAVENDPDMAMFEALRGFKEKYGHKVAKPRTRAKPEQVPQGNTKPRVRARVRRPANP